MTATSVLSTVISAIGSIVTGAVTWIGSFLTMITTTGNELVLLAVLIPFVGLGIGLLVRLLNVRA